MALEIYGTRTAAEILDDMLENVDDTIDKREGSVTHDMLAPAAIELEMLGYELDGILELGFIETSEGDFLTRRCSELGVDRKPGSYARATVKITGQAGTMINVGEQFTTAGGLAYEAIEEAVIDESGVATVEVIATEYGEDYNVGIGEINQFDAATQGIESVTNEAQATGGISEESDEDLKERYYLKVRQPVTSGNVYHYQALATEVTGVGSARVTPLHNGPGTVKVVIAGSNGGAVTPETVALAKANIDANAIIGADVTVVGVVERKIALAIKLEIASGYELAAVTENVKAAVNEYFDIASADGIIRYTQVGNAIIDVDGIIDYSGLTLDGATANITLSDETVAALGTVTIT